MNNRLRGIMGIAFGLMCFSPFFFGDSSKLIFPEPYVFIVKYFLVICIINAGLLFLLFGILRFIGLREPQTKYESARSYLMVMAFLSPFLVSVITTIFTFAQTPFWKIFGWVFLIYLLFYVYINVRTLQKGTDE